MTRSRWYNQAEFRLDDAARLGEMIDAMVFGILVTGSDLLATHLPFLLDRDQGGRGTLRAHLAQGNDHWRSLDGQPALVIFQGPEHYVTPSWYASKARTGRVVPTWNYAAVHVRGRVHVHHDRERLRALVGDLTARMEAGRADPWQVDDAPADYVSRMLDGIVGIDVEIEHLEGKLKLGQNRSAEDRASLAANLADERPDVWSAITSLPRIREDPAG